MPQVRAAALLLAALSFGAAAAPRIETLTVKPGKPLETEIVVGVSRASTGSRNCDVAVDLGDGSRARQLDFGVATTRSLRHTYKKAGKYKVVAKGAGKTPCEGTRDATLTVSGPPEAKKKPAKKEKAPKGASSTRP